ncbi:MAG: TlpA family protein disulfide reductase [Flavobacteriaceae bacterium]|nr:TlpA family protein disulfide reductase [Flavobacteriaceae bacterium]
MKFNKKVLGNILFLGFFIFLFTPYGLNTRAKLTQGVTYIKTLILPPKAETIENRADINTDFLLRGIVNATDINLSELNEKVVFINYWATWCPPCRAEMPSIQSLYDDYKDKIEFIFITSDNKSKVEKFYSNHNYNLPTYNMLSNAPQEINTRSIPATFILDKQAKVALSEFGPTDWNNDKVRKLLDELLAE